MAKTNRGCLNWDDLDVVQELLAEIAPDWSAELNHCQPGRINDRGDAGRSKRHPRPGIRFASQQSGRVPADQFRWDEYRKLGGFRTFDEALAAMRSRLVPLVTRRPPFAYR